MLQKFWEKKVLQTFIQLVAYAFHFFRAYATMSVSICLSVTEVNWHIIANLLFKFRSKFTAHFVAGWGYLNNNISRYASHC